MKAQGVILLSFDGQEPDEEGPSLWLFIDVISNRVLRVVVIETADHETLHEIVDSILTDYRVKLIGMISDKQGSIVKMHDTYYPDIPHQYCHFHFLQNMWNHLEVKDGHVHKELAKNINHLYITSTSKETEKKVEGVGNQSIRKLFGEIEKDLRKLVKNRSKKFDHLRGIETHDKLSKYAVDIETTCANEDPSRWVVQTLLKTAASIREQLDAIRAAYDECVALNQQFQEIRSLLGNPNLAKAEKILLLDGVFESIWTDASKKEGISSKDDLRTFLPKISSSREKILLEWVRLYTSYKRGLFAYYDFPIPERTNVKIEKKFGQEKTMFFSRCAKTRVGMQVRTRGEYYLKQLFAGEDEIKSIILGIEGEYDTEQVKAGLEELERRIKEETEPWKSNIGGIDAIKRVLNFGKKNNKDGDLDEIKN